MGRIPSPDCKACEGQGFFLSCAVYGTECDENDCYVRCSCMDGYTWDDEQDRWSTPASAMPPDATP